jgi:uroporphyrin-III C-methyltransferase/precorrin-2 dehydrogenase/sirohydrochlorin ferrochelatase
MRARSAQAIDVAPARPSRIEARVARMEPLARLPVFFDLDGRRVVLAGGSDAAAWKAELLSATGAIVEVFAERPAPTLLAVVADPPRGAVHLHRRAWRAADMKGAAIAVGAIEDECEGVAFARAGRQAGAIVNVVDRPLLCDFAFGSIVNRSPLVIGISTDGAAPTLAQALRARIEAIVPRGLGGWAAAAKKWRPAIQAAAPSGDVRRRIWERFAAIAFARSEDEPTAGDLAGLLSAAGAGENASCPGGVTIVRTGTGDVASLTIKAIRALQVADVVVYDEGVPADFLEFARREARTMRVQSVAPESGGSPDNVGELMDALAAEGRRVVRLAI